jgi:GT2 family glycosyltransferase
VPFAGSDAELAVLLARLESVERRPGDEIVVVDNNSHPARAEPVAGIDLVRAHEISSSYFARNAGVRRARGEWLVFVDADTTPAPDLLDAYLEPAPAEDVGILAGRIEDRMERDTLVARYVAARAKMSDEVTLSHPFGAYAQTANCAVRREAFRAAGGFEEGIRSGGDADLCWRLQRAGWRLEARPGAVVGHRNRETLRRLCGQIARHGAGMSWLEGRYPGAFPRVPVARTAAHHLREAARALRRGHREAAAFALVDLATGLARDRGRTRSNAPRR